MSALGQPVKNRPAAQISDRLKGIDDFIFVLLELDSEDQEMFQPEGLTEATSKRCAFARLVIR
jgi:hypothetical protein